MRLKNYILLLICQLIIFTGFTQNPNQEIKTIKELHNQSYQITSLGLRLTDSNKLPNGDYDTNEFYQITFYSDEYHDNYKLNLNIELFDIAEDDTLYIYDGATTNSPLLYKGNNSNSCLLQQFYATDNFVTIVFKSNNINNGHGFNINIIYNKPCQDIKLTWDTLFYLKNEYNKISKKINSGVDTNNNFWYAFDICDGMEIQIPVRVDFPENNMYYNQTINDLIFKWDLGDGNIKYVTGDTIIKHQYKKIQGYNINVTTIDNNGCTSKQPLIARIRIAQNPIKTIFKLPTICSNTTIDIKISENNTGNIVLQNNDYSYNSYQKKSHRQFIPDGPNCDTVCFYSPIIFTEFLSNQKLMSSDDICAVCINMEHEYMGDLEISLICPEGNKAVLKYKPEENIYNDDHILEYPGGGGGNFYFGIPYGGNIHLHYNGKLDSTICDTNYNIPGIGWNYCWSTNKSYGYWDNNHNYNNSYYNAIYITKSNAQINVNHDFGNTIPNGYITNNPAPGMQIFHTTDSSYISINKGFYKPSTDFNSLVGCSLNGEWNIEICDTWSRDNGWIFGWDMKLCDSYKPEWTYKVGIDTVLWDNNPIFNIITHNKTNVDVIPQDTTGVLPINFTIIDSLQCYWDSVINITVVETPRPNLGKDTVICDYMSVQLSSKHHSNDNYSYLWLPTLDTTPSIQTKPTSNTTLYELTITNNKYDIHCSNKDDIIVEIAQNPIPSFSIDNVPFIDGCEPLTINIENYTSNVIKHYWDFGDGEHAKTSNAKHTYYAGVYDLSYTTTDERGCHGSVEFNDFIHVYNTPKARFQWEPEIPTMFEPTIKLQNLSMPNNYDNIYYWEIQYDKSKPNDFITIQEYEPEYTFQQYNNPTITGDYIVKLIVITNNLNPNGENVMCTDTASTKILIVNDFLQFPNVVTANGDGVNDIFKIVNLVEHIGFPNNELTILNRWGKVIYYKKNMDINTDFWDPNITNSPTGTYFYRFTAKGYTTNIQRNGVIEVLR